MYTKKTELEKQINKTRRFVNTAKKAFKKQLALTSKRLILLGWKPEDIYSYCNETVESFFGKK